jgi:hypothetical protein
VVLFILGFILPLGTFSVVNFHYHTLTCV